jgi:hypothetical protein
VSSNPVPEHTHASASADGSVAVPMKMLKGVKQSFQLTALPFTPVTLAWRHINYTVDIPPAKRGDKATKRQLLRDISGHAAPGRMVRQLGKTLVCPSSVTSCSNLLLMCVGSLTDGSDGFVRRGQDHADGRDCGSKDHGLHPVRLLSHHTASQHVEASSACR